MITATKFVTAGVVLAAVGGDPLIPGGLLPQTREARPAASATAGRVEPEPNERLTIPHPTVGPSFHPGSTQGALVMGEPDTDVTAGGWTERGTASYYNADGSGFGQLDHLQADRRPAGGARLHPRFRERPATTW